jgi:hypothetical protein
MPLSAPISMIVEICKSVDVERETAFLRALLVFMGEISNPSPFDQVKSFPGPSPIFFEEPNSPTGSHLQNSFLP